MMCQSTVVVVIHEYVGPDIGIFYNSYALQVQVARPPGWRRRKREVLCIAVIDND